MNRRGFIRLAAVSPLAAAAVPISQTDHSSQTSQALSFDIAVIGGSTTGVFAAVRAAEKGMKVALVENNALFGGTATAGFVPVWHSMQSLDGSKAVIGGLTKAILDRLAARGEAVTHNKNKAPVWRTSSLNVAALSIALDELVAEHPSITPMLSTRFVAAETDRPGHVTRAYVEDKDGRKALEAKFFIDCSGDADLLERAGFRTWKLKPCDMQAHTLCAIVANEAVVKKRHPDFSFHAVLDPRSGGGFKHVFGWDHAVIGCPDVTFNAFTRVSDLDPSLAGDLTRAMLEARAQLRRIIDHANKLFPMPPNEPKLAIVSIAPMLGIRESRHVTCLYSVTREDVLSGRMYDDVIARGTYRIDVHEGKGIRFLNLDGTENLMYVDDAGIVRWKNSRWRAEGTPSPECYSIPYRALVPVGSENVLCAGRMLDCSRDAYGALRVMVNCNQMGEAAGLAAAKAVKDGLSAAKAYAGMPDDA